MSEGDEIDGGGGDMLLGVALLYWALHERLERLEPELSKQEHLFLVRLSAPRRMGDLARLMQALPSTVTALADGLEARGLIARRRDPEDRRVWLLDLTEAGRARREDMLAHADRAIREATGLPEADLDRFAALLTRIRHHIRADGLPKGLPF
ncbi:MarR family winged helix-turn-helix transcriptional regulator [Limimaricola litoreus]|uniref:MarR family transcriptional regulator n=1 Tax=Limimaricola litoreus TaxID=2955316 RepID=A0A9X2JP52_9RHOB|nr:MarR family transcriptional regulator [Limimaricola litoreus]MCP1169662.1 MarR family transcriptional regulator [Limimaricola litoreus]